MISYTISLCITFQIYDLFQIEHISKIILVDQREVQEYLQHSCLNFKDSMLQDQDSLRSVVHNVVVGWWGWQVTRV